MDLGSLILTKVPGTALASDQPYRELDLAIDFCEDVPRLDQRAVDQIVMHFTAAGATSKVSSVHVNGWYGDFDKLTGCSRLLTERWGLNLPSEANRWAYMGDSANDEPMFEHFDLSIGVANVADFLPRMSSWPKYICQSPGGQGFAEAVQVLLDLRAISR